ncbi:Uma2 family endonuclease [Oscillatoria sp. FACHB-1406]|uniref:Uma2 family endonuclease n=1 Tax=Oscillatoria sp. FACHB-1406 TaxID=2692846 RepID=UPI0016842109|nr:Uma2 family endonuclease [Oscillatoria sp. FACHB-1406]MBD2579689.1 Uma2 family endonuclease [Oscillatoria sp. FACHB-1406]
MIQTRPKKLTFEEYLEYEDETDNRYELIDGELIALPPESGLNDFIARFLLFLFASQNLVPLKLLAIHTCEIQVPILQPGDAANRYPDLVVLHEEHWQLTQKRLTITLEMPPPQLVVEIVSPGRIGKERDYLRKRAQYAAVSIPEYWIIDPQKQTVSVLLLEGNSGQYCDRVFRGQDSLVSPTFPTLQLTVEQLFASID